MSTVAALDEAERARTDISIEHNEPEAAAQVAPSAAPSVSS